MNALIVGFGSYQADDQIGWQIVDQLKQMDTFPNDVSFLKVGGNAMVWLSQVEPDMQLIFIDAVRSDKPVGSIHRMALGTDLPISLSAYSSHGLGLLESLKLAQSLKLLNKPSMFYGVEIGEDGPFDLISHDVAAAIPEVIEQIEYFLLEEARNLV